MADTGNPIDTITDEQDDPMFVIDSSGRKIYLQRESARTFMSESKYTTSQELYTLLEDGLDEESDRTAKGVLDAPRYWIHFVTPVYSNRQK